LLIEIANGGGALDRRLRKRDYEIYTNFVTYPLAATPQTKISIQSSISAQISSSLSHLSMIISIATREKNLVSRVPAETCRDWRLPWSWSRASNLEGMPILL